MNQTAAKTITANGDGQLQAFERDVLAGLAQPQKTIPSRWLYDDRGSALFERITTLPEYYPTRTETEILEGNVRELAAFCGANAVVIEYGAGASIKSQILLGALHRPCMYVPVDIAGDFLEAAAARLRGKFPGLEIVPVTADFTKPFHLPESIPQDAARTGFFPGSTIGNLGPIEAETFLKRVRQHVTGAKPGDRAEPAHDGRALIGIDLVKPTDILIPAYDDAAGVTAQFNLNLLKRINRELHGTFDSRQFIHEARWNAEASAIEMHLVARTDQTAKVAGKTFAFRSGETIHTESSRKYSIESFAGLAERAGWRLSQSWTDDAGLFAMVGISAET